MHAHLHVISAWPCRSIPQTTSLAPDQEMVTIVLPLAGSYLWVHGLEGGRLRLGC